jgi:uncharacterized membrane protein
MRRREREPDRHVLEHVIARNIHALVGARERFDQRQTPHQRAARAATRFIGSVPFVGLQALLVGGWLVLNAGIVPGLPPWDHSFSLLGLVLSIEAIFLATSVLIAQNRMAEVAERRADLDLQINLLAEHEVTKLIGVVDAIAERLGVDAPERAQLDMLKQEVVPEAVLDVIDRAEDASAEAKDQKRAGRGA